MESRWRGEGDEDRKMERDGIGGKWGRGGGMDAEEGGKGIFNISNIVIIITRSVIWFRASR